MKVILYICIALFMLAGCSRLSQQHMLDAANKLADHSPDSALALLNECLFPEKLHPGERAMYGWLWAKACSNAGKSFTQDTLLEEAIKFYAHQKDSAKVLECYHLAGEQQKLKDDNLKALDYYLSGEQYLSPGNDSLRLTHYRLIMQQALNAHQYDISRKYARKMLEFNNIRWQTFAYYHISLSYGWENRCYSDSCFYYAEKCIALAEAHPDQFLAHYLRNTAMDPQLSKAEAFRRIRKSIQLEGESSNELLAISTLFMREKQLDSAACYLQRAEKKYEQAWSSKGKEYVSLRNEMAQLQACLAYARGEKDFQQSISMFNDSLYFASNNNQKSWEEQSILQERRAKRDLYFQRQQQYTQLFLLSSLFFLILTALGIAFYIRRKRNRLVEAEERAETLQQLLDDATLAASEDQHDTRFFKKILLQQLGIIRLIATTPTDHNKELLQQMAQISNQDVATDSLLIWNDLYPIINSAYDGFYTKLKARYGKTLNEKEMQLCCLLRAGFSTKEISVVSQQSTRTVYQRKTDIRRKLGMEEKEDIVYFIQHT